MYKKNELYKRIKGEGCEEFVDICFNGRKIGVWITKGFVNWEFKGRRHRRHQDFVAESRLLPWIFYGNLNGGTNASHSIRKVVSKVSKKQLFQNR